MGTTHSIPVLHKIRPKLSPMQSTNQGGEISLQLLLHLGDDSSIRKMGGGGGPTSEEKKSGFSGGG